MTVSEEKREAILRALGKHPDGATAKVIAADLGWKTHNASQRMGMMFFQGHLVRHNVGGIRTREYRYCIKAPQLQPQQQPQWTPPLRIAQRVTRSKERV